MTDRIQEIRDRLRGYESTTEAATQALLSVCGTPFCPGPDEPAHAIMMEFHGRVQGDIRYLISEIKRLTAENTELRAELHTLQAK